jgi:homoserine kinase
MVTVKVPATTANLGVGFDTFGLALNRHNTFTFTKTTQFSFQTSTHSAILSLRKMTALISSFLAPFATFTRRFKNRYRLLPWKPQSTSHSGVG